MNKNGVSSSSPSLSHPPLLTFTPHDLDHYYPNLPPGAKTAFFILRLPQQSWTPEARALLTMACVPPYGYFLQGSSRDIEPLSDDFKEKYGSRAWQKAKEDVDLWRLSKDLVKAKEEGWEQRKGILDTE
jgi:hypothetical protein